MARTSSSNFTVKMEAGEFWVDDEIPTGAVNGSNKVFTLSESPNPVGSCEYLINGQEVTLTTDYTISGSTLTTVYAYPTGTTHSISYRIEP